MHEHNHTPTSTNSPNPPRFLFKGFIYKGLSSGCFSIANAARLHHNRSNLEETSSWNIKVKEAVAAILMKPRPSPRTPEPIRGVWVDISEKEGNKTEEPDRSIKGWHGVKHLHCQGLLTAKWNQFLWVQPCQVGGGSIDSSAVAQISSNLYEC